MSTILVDIDTITARYNVHKTTISEWCKKCPEMRKNKNEYDLIECDYFYIKLLEERLESVGSASKLKEVQTKNFDLKNKLLEIEIAYKEKRFVDREEIQKNLEKLLIKISMEINSIPHFIKDFKKLTVEELSEECYGVSSRIINTLKQNHNIWQYNKSFYKEEIDYEIELFVDNFYGKTIYEIQEFFRKTNYTLDDYCYHCDDDKTDECDKTDN